MILNTGKQTLVYEKLILDHGKSRLHNGKLTHENLNKIIILNLGLILGNRKLELVNRKLT